MTPLAMQRLLDMLDLEQDEDVFAEATALPQDLMRLAESGGPGTASQVTALLGSPRLRHLMRMALAERELALPREDEEANAQLTPLRLAAASQDEPELPWQQSIQVGPTADAPVAAVLTVRKGRGPDDLYLTLRLEPEAWLEQVGGLRMRLAEPDGKPAEQSQPKPGFVWLEGETDDEGEISAKWPLAEAGAPPWTRLKRLKKRRLDLTFSAKR